LTNRALVLLSGEKTSIPEAEARALFLAYDPASTFSSPEDRILLVETAADPRAVSRRIAFARRVGSLLSRPSDASATVRGRKIRFRSFAVGEQPPRHADVEATLGGLRAEVDLENPDYELTLITGRQDYLVLTVPKEMNQAWSSRRPRKRPFFHPAAIFPKLSRALVNLTRCREGDVLLDPFVGTGSILIEASEVGLDCLAIDRSRRMAYGSLSNMRAFGQEWLGVIRANAFSAPLGMVDGVATDLPYGRASSAGGAPIATVVRRAMEKLPPMIRPGGRLVVMHPSHVPVEPGSDMIAEGEHYIYIHKKLTRAITILRKT